MNWRLLAAGMAFCALGTAASAASLNIKTSDMIRGKPYECNVYMGPGAPSKAAMDKIMRLAADACATFNPDADFTTSAEIDTDKYPNSQAGIESTYPMLEYNHRTRKVTPMTEEEIWKGARDIHGNIIK